jgi:hypothetical protein
MKKKKKNSKQECKLKFHFQGALPSPLYSPDLTLGGIHLSYGLTRKRSEIIC